MLTRKEILTIVATAIIISASMSFLKSWTAFFEALAVVFSVVMVNIGAKKISAFYFDSEIENKIWEVQRYGFKPKDYFNKPFPAGIFLPLITSLLTLRYFVWLAVFVFDIKPKIYRAAKRHGLYSFSEISEYHIGMIAAAGITANIIFSILMYFVGLPEFAKISVYYAFFNILPISDLDGNKIFFGSFVTWSLLVSLIFVGLGYIFLVV
ncbi:MAG: hypothetical protein AABX28_00810 [Nanoarchaeota archaeon]